MKDEIKEILDRLERIDHKEYSGGFEFADSGSFDEDCRCFEERKKLANYITNLQEENNSLKQISKDTYDTSQEIIFELQEKIEKAIEYIKENCIKSDKWEDLGFCNFVPTGKISYNSLSVKKVKELLNILQGVGKDGND